MLNWWLILLIIVIPLILIGLTVYVIFYFQSNEDKTTDIAAKAIFALGLILALGSVLLVPFDVANSPDPTVENKFARTLDTDLMWMIVLWAMIAMAVIVCPFFMFFYEAYDPDKPRIGKQIVSGIIAAAVITIVYVVITLACYFTVGEAQIRFESFEAPPQFLPVNSSSMTFYSTLQKETLTVKASVTTYFIGMACFFGWLVFFIYGGVGLVAYPINTIKNFRGRVKALSASRFAEEMAVVLAKADALLELSLQLQREARGRLTRAHKTKINVLRNEVFFLEAYQDQLIWGYTKAGGSPFIIYGRLIVGIICLLTGIVWWVHIFVYNAFHANLFLNKMLIELSNAFALCGIVAYGVLAFYLMWSTFQGQIALGLRLVFFQIHPMKRHDTTVNSMLFNVILLLFSAFAVLAFVSISFQSYAPWTSINGLMNVFVMHLRGIGYVIQWIPFAFLGVSLISILWVAICPKKKRKDPTKMRLDDLS